MSITRVTSRTMSNTALRGLQSSLGRTQDLQNQLSSGRRVNRPADDPAATATAMKLRSERTANQQYQRNVDDAKGRLNVADSSLTQLSERIRRAQELVLSANNGALGADSRSAIAAELRSIGEEVVGLYNTSWLGRPVFGGTVAGSVAVQPNGTYVGNDQQILSRINADTTLRVDVSGIAAGADTLPGVISAAANDVENNLGAIGTSIDALASSLNKVLQSLGDVGARAGRLETAQAKLTSDELDFTSRISENEDADLPETIMQLEAQKVGYQAALGTAAKILQTSLLDYLR
jgi:flagellar hook-associated protein 3 FlgL